MLLMPVVALVLVLLVLVLAVLVLGVAICWAWASVGDSVAAENAWINAAVSVRALVSSSASWTAVANA
jgi:hypothetical protein